MDELDDFWIFLDYVSQFTDFLYEEGERKRSRLAEERAKEKEKARRARERAEREEFEQRERRIGK